MNPKLVGEPGMLETDSIPVRVMDKGDFEAVVSIDAAATGRRRPRYFELMVERAVTRAALQVSLAAELDGRVVGFAIASLYYGEYGVVEPTASLDAIGVLPAYRGQHVAKALLRQLRVNLCALRVTTFADRSLMGRLRSTRFFQVRRLRPGPPSLPRLRTRSHAPRPRWTGR